MKKRFKNHDARCNYYSSGFAVYWCERAESEYGFDMGSLNYLAFCVDAKITDIPAEIICNLQKVGGENIWDLVNKHYWKNSPRSEEDKQKWLQKYKDKVSESQLRKDIDWEKGYRRWLDSEAGKQMMSSLLSDLAKESA